MKAVLLGAILVAIGIFAATSWSDVVDDDTASDPPASYVGRPRHEPLTPYDPGPDDAIWNYNDLNAEEKAVVDRNRNVDGWGAVHAGYTVVIKERAVRVAASSAEHQLGLEGNTGDIGVVP